MNIDLSNLLNSSESNIEIDHVFDMSDIQYSNYFPLKDGVFAQGSIYSKADVIYLELNISFDFYGVCDRCAEDLKINMHFQIDKILVHSLVNNEDEYDDKYIVISDDKLDIENVIREEILLFLPTKILCKKDCKGLCPKCGKNLNYGPCNCSKEINPAMAPLLQLLQED